MKASGQQDSEGFASKPGLLILTGASHTGKTSVAEAILPVIDPPAAFLSVDEILARSLIKPAGDIWNEIPLAYDLLAAQLTPLLERSWFVVLESTFTYVPHAGPGQFHEGELKRAIGIADQLNIDWFLVQLTAPREVLLQRAAETGRIPLRVVAATHDLHEAAPLPSGTLRMETGTSSAEDLAPTLLRDLRLRAGQRPLKRG